MTTDTLTLNAFLLARIEEDEARAASDIDHFCDPNDNADKWITMYAKRLAAECAAKRAIMDREHVECSGHPGPHQPHGDYGPGYCWREDEGNATLLDLASVYADHPDFNPDWA